MQTNERTDGRAPLSWTVSSGSWSGIPETVSETFETLAEARGRLASRLRLARERVSVGSWEILDPGERRLHGSRWIRLSSNEDERVR
jgi:hypothetical protein